jgi:hypothetical protein
VGRRGWKQEQPFAMTPFFFLSFFFLSSSFLSSFLFFFFLPFFLPFFFFFLSFFFIRLKRGTLHDLACHPCAGFLIFLYLKLSSEAILNFTPGTQE